MEQPEKSNDKRVLELIRLVDSKYKKSLRYTVGNPYFMMLIILIITLAAGRIYLEVYLGVVRDMAKDLEIVIPLIALLIAFLAVIEKETDNASIIGNYKKLRKDKIVNENNAPLLKSLVIMKTKQIEVNLEQIYSMNKDMFTLEKLLEGLYH
ncbi:TPA: BCD family MFS transporter [Candidatus Bathyarchaeota archaeon]|nr:BCD family MFS transporter [Candidatus Bathyarchaeota archaeon]